MMESLLDPAQKTESLEAKANSDQGIKQSSQLLGFENGSFIKNSQSDAIERPNVLCEA